MALSVKTNGCYSRSDTEIYIPVTVSDETRSYNAVIKLMVGPDSSGVGTVVCCDKNVLGRFYELTEDAVREVVDNMRLRVQTFRQNNKLSWRRCE